ncbi:hypothetical protein [Microbulbifer rhizosphaerae]|uniref:Uncharacterized protein n=1 Tax=Microbulbifer rhizosphaerae TaxID=1562603 RepID=A0A7W4W9L2_9GAMM|nr:hypothetical protein [Microbulbifer rhizosphaerae]MBB3059722.1 hypothetical protein [Microbulbifer rhizosphaerae]
MIPDPNTKEGREEIARRLKKVKKEGAKSRKRALKDIDSEPSGKLTNPSDIDRVRDRRDEDE